MGEAAIPGGVVSAVAQDRAGFLWLGTGDGLVRHDGHRVHPQGRIGDNGTTQSLGFVRTLLPARDGRLWIGTDKGLFRLAPGLAELAPVAMQSGAGLGNAAVIGLPIDRQQVLWVDTAEAGLHRLRHWDGKAAGFDAISARHGVVGRPFGVNLLEDGRGRIWTQQFVYDPATDQLTTRRAPTASTSAPAGFAPTARPPTAACCSAAARA